MKNTVLTVMLSLAFIGTGCLTNEQVEPEIIIEPVALIPVSRDSITVGGHLGIKIDTDAEDVYETLKSLPEGSGIRYVNVVGNIFSNVQQLDNRIHLYESIFLDEHKGTDSGVQIAFKEGKVSSIYLNNGNKLAQWPLKENQSASVRVGDASDALYGKLVKIQGKSSYANKFQRISMFTKDLWSHYDPIMTDSPQWYLRYAVEPKLYEHIQIYFESGKVKYLLVTRELDPS
jgi:hypothetical protein